MPTVPATQRLTADEYLALPATENAPRLQLIEGEVVVNDPGALHGHVQTNVLFALVAWSRAAPSRGHAVVPRDVAIDEHNVFSPDVLWYASGHLPDPNSPPPYSIPDLAVEIRSPSTWRYDVGAKKAGYERHGLPELWLVDTVARTVLVFRRSSPRAPSFDVVAEIDDGQTVVSPQLPSFRLEVSEMFAID